MLLIAGYETTATTLHYSSFVLSKYPDIQKKLYDNIRDTFDSVSDPSIDSDSVLKIDYLDWFIKEVIRFYPLTTS